MSLDHNVSYIISGTLAMLYAEEIVPDKAHNGNPTTSLYSFKSSLWAHMFY